MDRNDFASGKKQDKEAIPDARAKAKAGGKETKRSIGAGHAAVGKTLIPNSFIEKMDAFLPEKKKK